MTSFPGTWGVGLYWYGEAWEQSHWWWALQREVLENPSNYGRWGLCSHEGNVRSGCGLLKPEPVVLCYCTVVQEGWGSMLLHWLSKIECENQKRLLTAPTGQGSNWGPNWHRVFLLLGLKSRVLADYHGWGFRAVHCIYHGEHRILWVWLHAIWAV